MTAMTSLETRIENEVAALGDLSREELAARWIKAYGCPPPKGVKRGLLERAAAWHLQTRYLGGLSSTARKAIRDAVKLGSGAGNAPGKLADSEQRRECRCGRFDLQLRSTRQPVTHSGAGPSARHAAGSRMERQNACRRCQRGWFCL